MNVHDLASEHSSTRTSFLRFLPVIPTSSTFDLNVNFAILLHGKFKTHCVTRVALYHQWITARALYILYIARCVPARHSRKAARKSKGGQSGGAQQLASPQHLAASDTYIRHRHVPLPIPDIISCILYLSLFPNFSHLVTSFPADSTFQHEPFPSYPHHVWKTGLNVNITIYSSQKDISLQSSYLITKI